MKFNRVFSLIFIILLIGVLSDVDISIFNSQEFEGKEVRDLAGINVYCPNNGAMKYFKLVKSENNNMKFEINCYSAKSANSEYDEAILKDYVLQEIQEKFLALKI